MKVKLFDLAKELEVGVASLHELLINKNIIDTPYNPNIRIDQKAFKMIIGEYGSGLSAARKEEIESKFFPASTAPKVKTEERKNAEGAKPQTVKPEAPQAEKKPLGIAVKGHIDLSAKGKSTQGNNSAAPSQPQAPSKPSAPSPISTKAEPAKTAAPEEKKLQAEPAKAPHKETEEKPTPVVAVKPASPVEKSTPQASSVKDKEAELPTAPAPKVTPKGSDAPKTLSPASNQTVDERKATKGSEGKPSVQESKPVTPSAEKVEEKSNALAAPAPETKKEEVVPFRFNRAEEVPQLQIKGKIDLGSDPRGRKKGDKSAKSKRKRISAGAVDISAEVAKGISGTSNKPARPAASRGGNDRQQNRQQQQAQASQQQTKGRKARRNAQKEEIKQEVSSEDIEKKVKEVRARIAAGKRQSFGKGDARKRRDLAKRQAERDAFGGEQERNVIKITEFVTVSDLANLMGVPVNEVIATCMSIDIMVSINMRLDSDTITLIAEEFGFETEFVSADVVEAIEENLEVDNEEDLVERPPVVTVMGHVDHGKTSLLDHIRNTNVIAGEAGGITQHIATYSVTLKSGRKITFLDTPGHQAFTAMRSRGAKATDIVIIIIDATSDVMPQTKEALNHASAAGVPIVFAINKVDKSTANPNHIKEQLAQLNYLVEDWGGKYQSQEISAKHGQGVRELLDKVLLEADLLELRANPKRAASGVIIESALEKGRGYVSRVLVQNGTLRVGDMVLAGKYCGRVRALTNEFGATLKEASPSTPATLLGLDGAPTAGDTFNVLENEQEARNIAKRRRQLDREQDIRTQHRLTLDQIGQRIKIGNFKELNLIVKGDVDGSIEALADSFIKLSTEEIAVKVIHKAVGQISESDVELAKASEAVIIGFQVRPNNTARKLAEQYGVEIRTYSIIYDAIDDVTSAMEGMLAPEIREQLSATLEVLQVFNIKGTGAIAGCMVKEGKIKRNDKVRVIRDGIVIHTGDLTSLKRYKDDAKEVAAGLECGLSIQNYNDIAEGDILEAFTEIEVKKKL